MEKIAISMPVEVLRLARKHMRSGRAKSLSAFVSATVDERLRSEELAELLDAMDAQYGSPSKTARAWARKLLRRSSSTRER
jgi:hypothetical protein